LGLFEFVIAVAIIVGAPIVFWFFYTIITVRLGINPDAKKGRSLKLLVVREVR